MRVWFAGALALLAALVAVATSACEPDYGLPPPRSPAPAAVGAPATLHDEAAREVAGATSTAYDHVITIDEARGVYRFDCSGFVDYAVSNVAPEALDALRALRGTRRPNARTYVELLVAIPRGERRGRWLHVPDVGSLQPGDVVAWIAPVKKPDPWGIVNTGHVMIVDGAVRERTPGEWVVPIIDSSFGHGGADTRSYPGATGLGRGTIVLFVEDGILAGYRWTESPRSARVDTIVALGRVL
jgi:hypothetical protein